MGIRLFMNDTRSVAKEKPRKPREVRIPKRHGGGFYVLRMRDYAEEHIPGAMGLWPYQEPITERSAGDKPQVISGLCPLPAFFTLHGDGIECEVELVLDRVPLDKRGKRSEMAWVSVEFKGKRRDRLSGEENHPRYVPRSAVSNVPRLPLDTLLREAVGLAGVVGFWYPAGYAGAYFLNAEMTIRDPLPLLRADSGQGVAVPIGWASSLDRTVRDLARSTRPPRVNSDPPERLRLVARAYLSADPGKRHENVRAALEADSGFPYGKDNVKRLVAKCRKIGLIPKTDKRGRQ